MCFSATASFTASASLFILGILTHKKILNPHSRMLAYVPIIFSLQQAAEGVVWLSFTHPELAAYRVIFAYLFLICAFIIWPIWIPYGVYQLERIPQNKRVLRLFCAAGILFSLCMSFFLLTTSTQLLVHNHHIRYVLGIPVSFYTPGTILYLIATVTPFFVCSYPYFSIFGAALLASYIASYLWFTYSLISIWCFFAALLSGIVLFILP